MAWTLPPMTPRMAAFVVAYLAAKTVTGACKALGINKGNGFRLMKDERVQAAIALGEVPDDAIADAATVSKVKQRRANKARAKRVSRAVTKAQETAATYAEAPPVLAEPTPDLLGYDAVKVRNRLALIAEANAVDLFKVQVRGRTRKFVLRDLDELPRGLAYAVQRIEVTASGTLKVHLYSKLDALRLLGQATDAFRPGEGDVDKPAGGEMTEKDMTIEARMERYGNVISGKFRPKPVEPA